MKKLSQNTKITTNEETKYSNKEITTNKESKYSHKEITTNEETKSEHTKGQKGENLLFGRRGSKVQTVGRFALNKPQND